MLFDNDRPHGFLLIYTQDKGQMANTQNSTPLNGMSQEEYDKYIDEQVRLLKRHNRGRILIAIVVFALALLVGMVGYRYLDRDNWVDSFFNASMILGGLGPTKPMKNDAAKVFGGFYALFSGAFFLIFFAIIMQNLIDTRTEVAVLAEE